MSITMLDLTRTCICVAVMCARPARPQVVDLAQHLPVAVEGADAVLQRLVETGVPVKSPSSERRISTFLRISGGVQGSSIEAMYCARNMGLSGSS